MLNIKRKINWDKIPSALTETDLHRYLFLGYTNAHNLMCDLGEPIGHGKRLYITKPVAKRWYEK